MKDLLFYWTFLLALFFHNANPQRFDIDTSYAYNFMYGIPDTVKLGANSSTGFFPNDSFAIFVDINKYPEYDIWLNCEIKQGNTNDPGILIYESFSYSFNVDSSPNYAKLDNPGGLLRQFKTDTLGFWNIQIDRCLEKPWALKATQIVLPQVDSITASLVFYSSTGQPIDTLILIGPYHSLDYCSALKIEMMSTIKIDEIRAYPNPIITISEILLPIYEGVASLSIYDVRGKMVKRIKNIKNRRYIFSKEDLSSGIYMVKLKTKKVNYIKRIVLVSQ